MKGGLAGLNNVPKKNCEYFIYLNEDKVKVEIPDTAQVR